MTKEERAEMFMEHLAEEGYRPKLDDDGDVVFKHEGGGYCIIIDETDEQYFRIIFPGFWSIESEQERAMVEKAALHATKQVKVAKIFPVRDDTWAAVELFCDPPSNALSVLGRSLGSLQTATNAFRAKMEEQAQGA